MPADYAGNSQRLARSLGELSNRTVRVADAVGGRDASDYYRFTVSKHSVFDLTLSGLQNNADIVLAGAGRVITSRRSGRASESIAAILKPGTYYVAVLPANRRLATRYSLMLSTQLSPRYQQYSFIYAYGNGDSYSGIAYANGDRYREGEIVSQSSPNETGRVGTYRIHSVLLDRGSTPLAGRVEVRSYFDSETPKIVSLNITTNNGLGSESGYLDPSKPDTLFSSYLEADFPVTQIPIAPQQPSPFPVSPSPTPQPSPTPIFPSPSPQPSPTPVSPSPSPQPSPSPVPFLSQYYTFKYSYGTNKDYYTGTGYAAANTYTNGQIIYPGLNETGDYGIYQITSVTNSTITTSNQVWVSSYYDSETAITYTPSGSGSNGLGSEAGYVISGNSDTYFGNKYYEADFPKYQYYTFNYRYGNGDFYTGYGYANGNQYANGSILAESTPNETGYYGWYEISSATTYQGSMVDLNKVVVLSYYDSETAQTSTDLIGSGTGGLGSEQGQLSGQGAIGSFSRYNEADISTIDLQINGFDALSPSANAGNAVNVSYRVQNNGNTAANNFKVAFYLSTDGVFQPSDRLLSSIDMASLAAMSSTAHTTQALTLPAASDIFWNGSGTYYLLAVADSWNSIAETNETNNANRGFWIDSDSLSVTIPPTVSLIASDNTASETPGNAAQFTMTRSGSTASPLTVNYSIGGFATNGSDYPFLTGSLTIASGSATGVITLTPVNDSTIETDETVVLTLLSNANYLLSSSTIASAVILDNDAPDPGGTLASAEVQPTVFTRTETVNSGDPSDIYRFSVGQSGTFTATLAGLTGDADVRLIRDVDNDGAIDTAKLYNPNTGVLDRGEVLAWQWERGTQAESIRRFLTAGTYYLQVINYNNQTANYTLSTNFAAMLADDRAFTITPTYGTTVNATARNTIQKALDFWMSAIPHTTFNLPSTLSISFTEDTTITGETLATGGYRNVQTDANNRLMPTSGQVSLSTSYLSKLNSNPLYSPDTIIHEIAHVLGGIALLNGNYVNTANATYSANSYAGYAYGELKGTYTPTAIPMTTGEGSGSNLTHWREDIFGNESMTHITLNAIAAVSQLTLGALRDIGWAINFGAAQPYALPGSINPTSLAENHDLGTVPTISDLTGIIPPNLNSEFFDRFYRFKFSNPGSIKLNLTNPSTDVNFKLIYDANSNGIIDSGEIIATSSNPGTAGDFINLYNLNPGDYYVQVSTSRTLDSQGNWVVHEPGYTLTYEVNSHLPALAIGGSLTNAMNSTANGYFGTFNAPTIYNGSSRGAWLGDYDIDNVYLFDMATGVRDWQFTLEQFTADVSMELIYDANNNGIYDSSELLTSTTYTGATAQTIWYTNLLAGKYYVRVKRGGSTATNAVGIAPNSYYSLRLITANMT